MPEVNVQAWPRSNREQRLDANRRLVSDHEAGRACDYCRPGHGCVALWRARGELADAGSR